MHFSNEAWSLHSTRINRPWEDAALFQSAEGTNRFPRRAARHDASQLLPNSAHKNLTNVPQKAPIQ